MPALPTRHHLLGEQPRAVDHAPHVHMQDALPIALGGVDNAAGHADARVVDDNVSATQRLADPIDQGLHLLSVAHINGARPRLAAGEPDQCGGAFGVLRTNVDCDDGRALLRKLQRRAATDAAARTGNDGQLAGERFAFAVLASALQRLGFRLALGVLDQLARHLGHAPGMCHGQPVPRHRFAPPIVRHPTR